MNLSPVIQIYRWSVSFGHRESGIHETPRDAFEDLLPGEWADVLQRRFNAELEYGVPEQPIVYIGDLGISASDDQVRFTRHVIS